LLLLSRNPPLSKSVNDGIVIVPGFGDSRDDKGAKGRERWSLLGSWKLLPPADMNAGSTLGKLAGIGAVAVGIISSCCVTMFIFLDSSMVVEDGAGGAMEEEPPARFCLLFFLEPPPTGTLRREPPCVQLRRQALQK
jgi:hypothetical protein